MQSIVGATDSPSWPASACRLGRRPRLATGAMSGPTTLAMPEHSSKVQNEPLAHEAHVPRHSAGPVAQRKRGPKFAPRPRANHPGETQTGGEAEGMELSSHDIRTRDFNRAWFVGYSRADVDEYLTKVIAVLDDRGQAKSKSSEDTIRHRVAPNPAPKPLVDSEPTANVSVTAEAKSVTVLKHAQRTAADTIAQAELSAASELEAARAKASHALEQAQVRAQQIEAEAQTGAAEIQANAQAEADAAMQAARSDAARGLHNARDRAEAILREAVGREQQAERLEAEAELRLAHADQRLAETAAQIATQARHLDELATWLADHDIRPEDPSARGDQPSHASAEPDDGDVIEISRAEG